MTLEEFSKYEIETGDLDPDYILMLRAQRLFGLSDEEMSKWVVVKSCVYDSESELQHLLFNVPIKDLVRYGGERRKFKPIADQLFDRFDHFIKSSSNGYRSFFFEALPRNARLAMQVIQTVKGFGPWAAWKMADLAERVLGVPIDFSEVQFNKIYEYPLKEIMMVASEDESRWKELLRNDDLFQTCMERAMPLFGEALKMKAPPQRDRLVNYQEIETLFCKYHSHAYGHYKPGHDIEKLRLNFKNSPLDKLRSLADVF